MPPPHPSTLRYRFPSTLLPPDNEDGMPSTGTLLPYHGPNAQQGSSQAPVGPGLEASGQLAAPPLVPLSDHLYPYEQPQPSFQAHAAPFGPLGFCMSPAVPSSDQPGPLQSPPHSSVLAKSPPAETDMYGENPQGLFTPSTMAPMSPGMSDLSLNDSNDNFPQSSRLEIILQTPGTYIDPSQINQVQDCPMDGEDDDFYMDLGFRDGFGFGESIPSQYSEPTASESSRLYPLSPGSDHARAEAEVRVRALASPNSPDPDDIDHDMNSASEIDTPPSSDDLDDDYTPLAQLRPNETDRKTSLRRSPRKNLSTSSHQQANRVLKGKPPQRTGRRAPPAINKQGVCPKCKDNFRDKAALKEHTAAQHPPRYSCIFQFAGCDKTFAAKNEWKRHVLSQHIVYHFWTCECGEPSAKNHKGSEAVPLVKFFRRKDLFIQHLRRMHPPGSPRWSCGIDESARTWRLEEWHVRIAESDQCRAHTRCDLPTFMRCPVGGCSQDFRGALAFDSSMEHLGRHLEETPVEGETPLFFEDQGFIGWAEEVHCIRLDDAKGRWTICDPIEVERQLALAKAAEPLSPTSPCIKCEEF